MVMISKMVMMVLIEMVVMTTNIVITKDESSAASVSYLAVEDLEPPDPVNHPLELDALDVAVLPVHPLHPEDVVAEVQTLEPAHVTLLDRAKFTADFPTNQ